MTTKEIAQALGKLGGQARAAKLSGTRRKEIAIKASHSRKSYLTAKKKDIAPLKTCYICGVDELTHTNEAWNKAEKDAQMWHPFK